ncbi:MAG: riboflavin biosynthesis protein RibF [Candidatus Aminicenantes bacterium]|nr:riboflavin biosynthesis protein RibF [Candidatus Aminicenantes bacterium]
MVLITRPSQLTRSRRPTAVAIGNFDGLHLGHRRILKMLVESARRGRLRPVVLTFSPHPEKVLGRSALRMIQTLPSRDREIRRIGVPDVRIMAFNRSFAHLPAARFVEDILVRRLKARVVVVGAGFRFGDKREGSVASLKAEGARFGFLVKAVPPLRRGGALVSSSRIRSLLEAGRIGEANRLLGRPYEIEGRVVRGRARGRTLGFPTANIRTPNEILPGGIFIARVVVGVRALPALAYIGSRPTFLEKGISIEVHCLDFRGSLYGRPVRVQFLKKLRNDRTFPDAGALVRQMEKDAATARARFRRSA